MSEWIESPLSQLVTFQKGRKVDTSRFASEGYAAYLGASGMEGGDDGYAATQFAVLATPTDTLMLWDGERSGLVGYGRLGVVASTVSKLSPNDRIEPKYLFFALSNSFAWIQHRRTGTGVPHVPKDLGRILKLSYPKTVAVQKRIAAILSGIDMAIETTEALIGKYQQIKTGLMHDLFTRGVLPNGQLRTPRSEAPELYQETAIGWIPREWDVADCASSFVIESGITLGPHRRPDKRPHPYLRVANVHRDDLRLDDVAQLEAMPAEIEQALRKYDLLVVEGHANRTEIGRCAMVMDDAEGMLFQNHLFRLRPHNMEPHYSLFWMNSHYARRYWEMACSTSSGLNTINRKMLGRMPVLVPSRSEQGEIVKKALGLKRQLQSEIERLTKLQKQKLGLMQDLLTGKVPVDEPEATHA